MKDETSLQNAIKIALCDKGCIVHRANVGKFYTLDGRIITLGSVGHSDLYGHTPQGKAFYIEVKTAGKKPNKEQKRFLKAMRESGAISGVARSDKEALKIVFGGDEIV